MILLPLSRRKAEAVVVATAITLPGGALIEGRLERAAAFRRLTGRLEQQLAEAGRLSSVPGRVSRTLACVLEHIGHRPVSEATAASLGIPDRHFLMTLVAREFGGDQQWRHLICTRCESRFDVDFRLSELPMTLAAPGYPWTDVCVAESRLRLRMPTGADESAVFGKQAAAARRALAQRCVVSVDGQPPNGSWFAALDDAAIDAIDAALDAAAPQLAILSVACSSCGGVQTLEFNPYAAALWDVAGLYRDVHRLASHYHWSEAQCLRLPRERRRLYLELIDASLGVSH